MAEPIRLAIVTGEESGDQLGAKLMRALKDRLGKERIVFSGVGGRAMAGEGLTSLFPMEDIAVMGFTAVVVRLPTILERIRRTADSILTSQPHGLVIIDSPDFTHRVAARVRRALPDLPIVDYVSPSVWAWRPGRARKMRAYVDHLLALLPFEPEAHRRLGGPPTTYVGHPLIERLHELRPTPGERLPLGSGTLELLVLPGSRRTEIKRLLEPFGETLRLLRERYDGEIHVTLPAVDHLAEEIAARTGAWPLRPTLVRGEAAKWAAFRRAHSALAASGTVTLELALSGVPMVVAYRVSKPEELLKYVVKVPSIVLTNLILGENVVPELLQQDSTPQKLSAALVPLLRDGPERARQVRAFERLDEVMAIGEERPSERAARVVVETMGFSPTLPP